MARRTDEGQAATELALVLPVLVLLLLAVVQVTVIARDQVLVVHAAREAARQASIDFRPSAIRSAALRAAPGLKPGRLGTDSDHGGAFPVIVTVRVVYRAPTDVALIGPLLPDVVVEANAAMRREVAGEL
ncbi:MAG TPA: TadE/TadG family type IV pilus assembly protein [Acidimicrobiales bacterium]|nr:TadE/TadG family type IV pilus assembly protein [Acidimicrobiales bacterium]